MTPDQADRLAATLRRRAAAFRAEPEPVRTHLREVPCRCGSPVYAAPESPIEALCTPCRWEECGGAL